jgi:diguanylate cyclase (GGDEF)-like protein
MFDIVISLGPYDTNLHDLHISINSRNIVGYRNIYVITDWSGNLHKSCIKVPESVFPFSLSSVADIHGPSSRNGWYLQQLFKLYAGLVIPGILHRYLVVDADTFFLRPVIFENSDGKPLGIVDRQTFVETFIKPFGRELYAKRKISDFMVANTIMVDMDTSIDDVSKIIIDAGMQHMMIGFIITENGRYVGIANGHDLLNEIMHIKQDGLFYLAHFDQLTNLPNRLLFMDRLSKAVSDANRKKSSIGLLFIDLDNFKNFNDSMGHGFGDQILIAVANRLLNCAREMDTVARLSGDEFVMIIEDVKNDQSLDILCNRIFYLSNNTKTKII